MTMSKVGVAADSTGRWYEVSDAPPGEKDAAGWQRVLAVFVQGKDWQFRGWPFKARSSRVCCSKPSWVHQLKPARRCHVWAVSSCA